jgi:hypothetical protein
MRSTLKLTVFATLTSFALATGGCSSSPRPQPEPQAPVDTSNAKPGYDPDNPAGPPAPLPQPPSPKPNYSGIYGLTAPIDFSENGVLPGAIGPALKALSDLHDKPGTAIWEFLQGANIDYVSSALTTINSIPLLPDILKGMFNDLIVTNVYGPYPAVDQIANIISGITELATKLELADQMTIHRAADDGSLKVDHKLTAVTFMLLDKRTTVPMPSSASGTTLSLGIDGKVTPGPAAPVADGTLTVTGTSTFSMPIGSLMLEAAGPLVFSQFGGATDLRGALLYLVPCQSFGDALSSQWSLSFGQSLCEAAMGIASLMVEGEIKKITLDNVKLDAVNGNLYDVSMSRPNVDYQSDRIAEGHWNWTFTVGSATATVPSTFAGDRTGDAN